MVIWPDIKSLILTIVNGTKRKADKWPAFTSSYPSTYTKNIDSLRGAYRYLSLANSHQARRVCRPSPDATSGRKHSYHPICGISWQNELIRHFGQSKSPSADAFIASRMRTPSTVGIRSHRGVRNVRVWTSARSPLPETRVGDLPIPVIDNVIDHCVAASVAPVSTDTTFARRSSPLLSSPHRETHVEA